MRFLLRLSFENVSIDLFCCMFLSCVGRDINGSVSIGISGKQILVVNKDCRNKTGFYSPQINILVEMQRALIKHPKAYYIS